MTSLPGFHRQTYPWTACSPVSLLFYSGKPGSCPGFLVWWPVGFCCQWILWELLLRRSHFQKVLPILHGTDPPLTCVSSALLLGFSETLPGAVSPCALALLPQVWTLLHHGGLVHARPFSHQVEHGHALIMCSACTSHLTCRQLRMTFLPVALEHFTSSDFHVLCQVC